jgi:hypothetical protein
MLSKKIAVLLLALGIFNSESQAKLSDYKEAAVVVGIITATGYCLYKLVDYLNYENDETFQLNSSELLGKIEISYSTQIKALKLLRSGKIALDPVLEKIAEDVIVTDAVDNYLMNIENDLHAVQKRLTWRSRNVDQNGKLLASPYLAIEIYMQKLANAEVNLKLLKQFLRKDYLDLYLFEKRLSYKYVVELQGKVAVNKIAKFIIVRGGHNKFLNYVIALKADRETLGQYLENIGRKNYKLVGRAKALLEKLNLISALVEADACYVAEKRLHDQLAAEYRQRAVNIAVDNAYLIGLNDGRFGW